MGMVCPNFNMPMPAVLVKIVSDISEQLIPTQSSTNTSPVVLRLPGCVVSWGEGGER